MSYRGAMLQAALFDWLTGQPDLTGVPVVDALPTGQAPLTYVLIGPEEVRDASDKTGHGAEHRVTVSVISEAAGFLSAKILAESLGAALDGAELPLSEGRVVSVRFQRAVARRLESGTARRIDLTYHIRVDG